MSQIICKSTRKIVDITYASHVEVGPEEASPTLLVLVGLCSEAGSATCAHYPMV